MTNGLNNIDTNNQRAFDAANNYFVPPVDGTYLLGATLLSKVTASTSARMSGPLVLNGTTETRGSRGEIGGAHVSEATALGPQTMVVLSADDPVELQGNFRAADGYFAANQTSVWGTKTGCEATGKTFKFPGIDKPRRLRPRPWVPACVSCSLSHGSRA